MSTSTTDVVPTYVPLKGNVSFAGVLGSEWVKLRSLRSTVWSLIAAVGILIGLGLLFSFAIVSRWDRLGAGEKLRFDPTAITLRGVFLAQLAIGVLGVLIIGGEFATGMIRSSLAAVPRRTPVLLGKAVVFGLVTWVLMTASAFIVYFAGQAVFSQKHVQSAISDPGVLRAVFGAGIYLTLIGLLGLGIATLLRNSAAAISTLVAIVLIVPILVSFLPSNWVIHIDKWLPSEAGMTMLTVRHDPAQLSPLAGGLVLTGYVVVVMGFAIWDLKRRDV